ncbi:NaeI family type II restriction endonuclease [Streptomyces griseosporeus]
MTSDPAQPTPSSALRRLLDVLGRAGGYGANATELAELIWLASHSGTPTHGTRPGIDEPPRTAPNPASADAPDPVPAPSPRPQHGARPLSHRDGTEPADDDAPYTSLLAPLPPMLAHPLRLQRALRPLRRRVPSRLHSELDERGTADRIARKGAATGTWLPVLRASPERWLTLYLVYDAGPTMPVWRPLWRELHRVLGQTGAFRGIQLLALTQDGRLRRSPGGRPAALPPRDGRAAALVLSDCSGPHWYAGSEETARWYRTLSRWAGTMPVAVVQPLPERLWRRTALPGTAGLLTARGPAAANTALKFTPYDTSGGEPAGLPLPLLEPSARWFGHWAELVTGRPGTEIPGVVATLAAEPAATAPEPPENAPRSRTPEELVRTFRAHASPGALRLAAHVAAGDPSLPVMRLVQAATEERPEPQHLAEVVLSGLLTTVPGRPASSGHYAFRPGVRDVLLRAVPRSTAARIDAVIRHYAGTGPGEFPVVTSAADGEGTGGRPYGEPLAVVTEETLRRLGGSAAAMEPDQAPEADGPEPSMRADDAELDTVARAVLALDPSGTRMGRVLRGSFDAALNGPTTGRYDWKDLFKTEKVHFGTQVEVAVQREFAFPDGDVMDYRIAGVEVDCKYSQTFGGWMIPPECQGHLILLIWADDYASRWSAGLLRVRAEWLRTGENRDAKSRIRAEHRDKILWLWRDADLPENILLHMSDTDREAVLAHRSAQHRVNELFARVQHRRIDRNTVRTVARQQDYMKRIRGTGGTRSALRDEGIIVLGDYPSHRAVARGLGLPVPQDGEFVSARVVPAIPGADRPVAEIDGGSWTLAAPDDPVATAPVLR